MSLEFWKQRKKEDGWRMTDADRDFAVRKLDEWGVGLEPLMSWLDSVCGDEFWLTDKEPAPSPGQAEYLKRVYPSAVQHPTASGNTFDSFEESIRNWADLIYSQRRSPLDGEYMGMPFNEAKDRLLYCLAKHIEQMPTIIFLNRPAAAGLSMENALQVVKKLPVPDVMVAAWQDDKGRERQPYAFEWLQVHLAHYRTLEGSSEERKPPSDSGVVSAADASDFEP